MSESGNLVSWKIALKSTPAQFWPWLANTNRFNQSIGLPEVAEETSDAKLENGRKRGSVQQGPLHIVWDESPFQWNYPYQFRVERKYFLESKALFDMVTQATLTPLPEGGTRLDYQFQIVPKSFLGKCIAVLSKFKFGPLAKVEPLFRKYDAIASSPAFQKKEGTSSQENSPWVHRNELGAVAEKKLESILQKLNELGFPQNQTETFGNLFRTEDVTDLMKMRPYHYASSLGVSRKRALELFLHASRLGAVDLQWSVVCPLCRGSKAKTQSLRDLKTTGHCESCRIDFSADFDRFVEVSFKPNPSILEISLGDFCMGSPERTPHILFQELLAPGGKMENISVQLAPGQYRVRTLSNRWSVDLEVEAGSTSEADVRLESSGLVASQKKIACEARLRLLNHSNQEQLFILENNSWDQEVVTAAEVTTLQTFRDLFSSEALIPGNEISVGNLTLVFTDLKGSTQFYQEVGDAPAFGEVMSHFDVLKECIDAEEGTIVKTIGDAVMAAFRRPAAAIRALSLAQERLLSPRVKSRHALILKAGIHQGPTIAVTLNDRLDYFGTTVNFAARLEGQSNGSDLVISESVFEDPEVQTLIKSGGAFGRDVVELKTTLKGFGDKPFRLWRLGMKTVALKKAS